MALARKFKVMVEQSLKFETDRLAFCCWGERHREPFAAMNADPEVMRYFLSTLTREQSIAGFDHLRTQMQDRGWGLWAVERKSTREFLGFIGLSIPQREYPFSPCVEVGWRLCRDHWGHGYATEGARACLRVGFGMLGLEEIVSFTALSNLRSRAVMERIGLQNTHADFEHPAIPLGHPLRTHCLYRLTRSEWENRASQTDIEGEQCH